MCVRFMQSRYRLLIPLLMLGLSATTQALPEDRNEPIRITADSAIRNERQGTTLYEGNVVLTQGSLIIHAEALTIESVENNTNSIVATGQPATLEQTPKAGQAPVFATAGRIVYRQQDDQITLTEDAHIEQDGATVSGAVINYLVSEQRVQATAGDSASEGQRVEVVIPPAALSDDTDGTRER